MEIVIQDASDGKVYTKYSLPNVVFVNSEYYGSEPKPTVILFVTKGPSFPTQEEFIIAGMK